MENPFETSVEVLPAATMTPVSKPQFEITLADILAAAQAQVEQSKKIVVTDPTDVDGIKQSREYRLALRKLRCAGNDAHKDGKADILRAGRAIDGMKNIILQVCEPEEARLEGQEKIAERIASERAAKLRLERESVLVELGENPAFWGPFERFPVEDWNQRVEVVRAVIKAREEQAKRQAEEAARKAKEDAEERERMRAENARLKAEADAREAAMKAEREAAEKARREAEEKAAIERAAIEQAAKAEAARLKAIAYAKEAEARKEREAAERARLEAAAKAKAEREAIEKKARDEAARVAEIARKEREAIEAKAKAERDAIEANARAEREAAEAVLREERARAKAIEDAARAEAAKLAQERDKVEADARAKEEAEREAKRKAEAAPDRDKLIAMAETLELCCLVSTNITTPKAASIHGQAQTRIMDVAAWIRGKAGEL